MHETLRLDTTARAQLVDITAQVRDVVARSGVRNGLVALFCQHTTAALTVQEHCDESVPTDLLTWLREVLPPDRWQHDAVDGNGDAHLKAALIGPSEAIPVVGGQLALGRWQHVFFCEFDGPRAGRTVLCTVLGAREA